MKKYKLLDNRGLIIYKGEMQGDRLERPDIEVDDQTYLDLICDTEYIHIENGEQIDCYIFEDYLDSTMTEEEMSKKCRQVIYDSLDEKAASKRIQGSVSFYGASYKDFWDVVEYIREHQEE